MLHPTCAPRPGFIRDSTDLSQKERAKAPRQIECAATPTECAMPMLAYKRSGRQRGWPSRRRRGLRSEDGGEV